MIDTLTIARDLQNAGVAWKQAQAHAKAIADAAEKQHQDVATKDFVDRQISTVRAEISDLRGEMNIMESNLRGEMRAQGVRLVRWIVAIVFSGMGILFAALRSLSS